jgi:hypothetical protein
MTPTLNSPVTARLEPIARALPIILSLAMIALALASVAALNGHRDTDEGWAAHIFQLAMVGQLPFIGYLIFSDSDRRHRNRVIILAQAGLWFAALALVRFFNL